ncbi:MAG TPA: SAM-dependent methyltransferase [Clostridia bacterium]|nr:SAM-dependent methyltransferase [Clostridia bacterium]
MHLFISAADSATELQSELEQSFTSATVSSAGPMLLQADFEISLGQHLPYLAFSRQWLPNAQPLQAESIRAWATELLNHVVGILPDDQPWLLHIEPLYGGQPIHRMGARAWHSAQRTQNAARGPRNFSKEILRGSSDQSLEGADQSQSRPEAEAGRHRCHLIRENLVEMLQKKRRHLLRQLQRQPVHFTANASLVQLLLTSPEAGFISVAPAPIPFEERHLLSPFPGGSVAMASDKAAPSRAFAKLVEAEQRLNRTIKPGETCVDLGASPGSWTYVAVSRGARVISVDRSPLREDLMLHPHVKFQPGDAFRFQPSRPVDWLLCDVIAVPERTAELLLNWLQRRWCRHFVVTVKLKDIPGADVLAMLKRELPLLTSELFLTRLCANKKEICAFGVVK